MKHCWGIYEQLALCISVSIGDWTAELAIIASNVHKIHSPENWLYSLFIYHTVAIFFYLLS